MTDHRDAALHYYDAHKMEFVDDLKALVRIPSISFSGFDPAPVLQCADAVADLMRRYGLHDVRLLETGKGAPAVFGQLLDAPDRPTLLLYAHYDVQPTGRAELWKSDPFDPVERDGRLYGRGTADDKGGAMLHLASMASWLRANGRLPVNVKFLIEGEEEVGSSNLDILLQRHANLFAADAVLIADSEHFDSGIPTVVASLRGLVTVCVEVRSLASSVHSGTWGGPLPDPVIALAKMIAGLVDERGVIAIPGMLDRVREPNEKERESLDALASAEDTYRKQSGLLPDVETIGGSGTPHEKMWRRPSIAVNAIEASSRRQAANIINDTAWARIGIRIVPDMDPVETLRLLTDHLQKSAPWGVQVTITPESPAPWWITDTGGRFFEMAMRALEKGYGGRPVIAGAGGSIPFVRTMTDALGGAPALLLGVGDPYSAAHSENESLLLSDWEKACRGLIHLFAELGEGHVR